MIELILLCVIIFFIILIGFFMMRYVTHPHRTDFAESKQHELAHDYWGDYDSYEKEPWDITTADGTVLHGTYLPGKDPDSRRYVILTHGYSYNRHGSIKYAHIFYQLGFHIYLYDLRYHGENEYRHHYCSMGDVESHDLAAVIDAMYARFGDTITLGIHGESLGAATSLLVLALRQNLAFCIADCPFADLRTLLYYQARQMFHMPKWMVHVANTLYRLIYHRNFFSVVPADAVQKNHVPLMLIHGDADDFIPPEHSRQVFEACPSDCIKEIHFMPNAQHAGSYGVDASLYQAWVEQFLRTIASHKS